MSIFALARLCLIVCLTLVAPGQALPRTTKALNSRTDPPPPPPLCGTTIPGDCCTSPYPRSFPRTTDTQCPTNQRQCCQKTKEVISATPSNTELNCGKSPEKTSTVTVKVESCGERYVGEQCLHITYNNVQGETYKEFHLQIDDEAIESSVPGHFTFTEFCSFSDDKTTVDCWVPQSAIIATFDDPKPTTLCGKTIYVAAHSTISDGNTCWVGVDPIIQKSNNWAKQFSIKFTCTTECSQPCCCPVPPTNPCVSAGTAFAKSNPAYPLTDLGCQRWGWYFPDYTAGFTLAPLILGQTTQVGNVGININNDGVQWQYNLFPSYGLIEYHVEVSCTAIPPKQGNNNPCAPGKFKYNSGCLVNSKLGQSWSGSAPKCPNGHYWMIFHASIFTAPAGSSTCVPVCPPSDDEI